MKILVIADEVEQSLYDYYTPDKTKDIDLIISCGDLRPRYLEFLNTIANIPLIYVRGNHDDVYKNDPPLGCDCIEDMIYDFKGLRILGLGGSMKYNDRANMYTEAMMEKRIKKLGRMIRLMNGFDILVTHAPARGYGDMDDLPHMGFECFNTLLEEYKPKYMLHGHVHKEYGSDFKRERIHPSSTKIINAYGHYVIEIDPTDYPQEGKTGSRLYDWYFGLKMKNQSK